MEKHYEDDEIEIDLKELFFELVNNWVMIVISTILVALIAFCISKFIMVPQYTSTAQLYVFTKSTSITNLADLQTSANLTNDYKVVVTGRPVLEQVIENLKLEEETYGSLSTRVAVNNPSNSRILEITVTDPDPAMAKKIADEIADVSGAFISEKMDQDPPSVLQYGYVAKNAVSPNTMMNTVLGAAIGAFLAMAIVIISYLMNDTIMTAEDIERKLD
ncbi:MAG: capsular biosynthesis protein, partial [Agathobacter sp.]|nr:capsular biosynthesis protein [Agathobacter sp.]